MMTYPYAELHAFPDGDRPHSGNPAGVMPLSAFLPDADLQGIAQSNNLAETAYLVPKGPNVWDLRWFTPEAEVDLCGHATLASAVWLFEEGHVAGDLAGFDTRSGRLTVRRDGPCAYTMDFPAVPPRPETPLAGLIESLNAPAAPDEVLQMDQIHGAPYRLAVFASAQDVAGLRPDFGAMARAGANVLATARGPEGGPDIVCRFFAPLAGIPEDPVTGSAYCTLAPFWSERLGLASLTARQIGPRPGALTIRNESGGRVSLIGTAARYLDGTIRI